MDKHVTHYQQEKPKKPHPSAAERLRMGLARLCSVSILGKVELTLV